MNADTLKLVLAIWGAALSTILGIIAIIKFRRDSSLRLLVFATVEKPFEQLQISVVNDGLKPATITHCSIRLGSSAGFSGELLKKQFDTAIKLSESDRWTVTIGREELIDLRKASGLAQKPFQRLWALIYLSNGKAFSDWVYINPNIIEKPFYKKAEQFIATDIFLGFSQMDSEAYPIGLK